MTDTDNVIHTEMGALSPAERLYVEAIGQLVAAEIEEAEAFLARKYDLGGGKVRSDWEARAMAAIDTGNQATLAKAAVEIALNRMRRESPRADQPDD
jgi:hypothetical protein